MVGVTSIVTLQESNIELLRIIAMLMIIAYHYVVHGQMNLVKSMTDYDRIFLECFQIFGKIGVNLYVLISGFYGVRGKFSWEKTAKLERQILFFSWLGIIVGLISNRSMAKRELLSMLFPTVGNIYWFATAYMILYFLSPWYNKLLMSLDKKEYQKLLLTMTVIWSVIPCLTLRTYDGMNVNQQIWMFVIYAYGGYIYRFNWKIENSKGLLCIGIVGLYGTVFLTEIFARKFPGIQGLATYFGWSNTVLAVPISLLLFNIFRMASIKYNAIINFIGAASFSTYLFHENPIISSLLWQHICLKLAGAKLITYSILVVFTVYVMGSILHIAFEIVDCFERKCLNKLLGRDVIINWLHRIINH